MKKGTCPEYIDTEVTCACGNKFVVKSNKKEMHLEVCSKCHPAYNGGKGISTKKTGTVEKFKSKYGMK